MKPRQTLPISPNAQDCAKIIGGWIDQCSLEHIFCNEEQARHFLPTRLIDVGLFNSQNHVRLVCTSDFQDTSAKFAALSHCWGARDDRIKTIPKTTKATIQDRLERVCWDELTQTFQDAIAVTRSLNLRYIWIDSLCIVQNDEEDFAREASQMASIYGEAHVVLAATSAATGDIGLFQNRAESQLVSRVNSKGRVLSLRVKKEIEHTDFTTGEPRHFASTPLFARAWCFQERLLARRVVHFADDEMIFECKEKLWCECTLLFPEHELYQNFKVRLAYSLRKESAKARFQAWYSVLRPYTARSLSFESDRFPALSGFARLIAIPELGSYCAGLWRNELPSGLLWRVIRALPENNDVIQRPEKYRAPTWSWAGVQAVIEGHITFHDTVEAVAHVLEVDCTPAGSDPFGEVTQGHIVLEAPMLEVTLDPAGNSMDAASRAYLVSRVDEDDRRPMEADLHLDGVSANAVCVAIERWTNGFCDNRVSCLVLQKCESVKHYSRAGTIECPYGWFGDVRTKTVTIV